MVEVVMVVLRMMIVVVIVRYDDVAVSHPFRDGLMVLVLVLAIMITVVLAMVVLMVMVVILRIMMMVIMMRYDDVAVNHDFGKRGVGGRRGDGDDD